MSFTKNDALIISVVNAVDATGAPSGQFPAPIVWTTSDATILALTPSADGLSATGTLLQDGTVTVTATSGSISASLVVNGVAGQVVSFSLSAALAPPPPPPAGPPASQTA